MLKQSASTTEVARDARDMRERRDVERVDSTSLARPASLRVSHGYPA